MRKCLIWAAQDDMNLSGRIFVDDCLKSSSQDSDRGSTYLIQYLKHRNR